MSTQVEPVVVSPVLATPDPALTSESFVALLATVIPALLVLFKFNVDDATQAAIIAALGSIYTVFTLWHAKGVRAARAIATAVREGTVQLVRKP